MLTLTFAVVLGVMLLPVPQVGARRLSGHSDDREQMLAGIAAHLRSGVSLRHALADVAEGHPELTRAASLARSGAPLARVVEGLGGDIRLQAAVTVAAASGGRSAAVFQRLADRVAAEHEEARQKTVLTAQARLSAVVVAAMPVFWLVFGGVGRLRSLLHGGAWIVAVLGLAMETLGVALIWRLASR